MAFLVTFVQQEKKRKTETVSKKGDCITSEKYPELVQELDVWSHADLLRIVEKRSVIASLQIRKFIRLVGHGYCASFKLPLFEAKLLILSKYYPEAVLSGVSALVFHQCYSSSVSKVDVVVDLSTSLRNKLFATRRVADSRLIGISEYSLHGKKIRAYTPERALVSLVEMKTDRKIINDVLKANMRSDRPFDLEKIREFDSKVHVNTLDYLREATIKENYMNSKRPQDVSDEGALYAKLLGTALKIYADRGSKDLTLKLLSKEVGLDVEKLVQIFGSNTELKNTLSKTLKNRFENELPIFKDLPSDPKLRVRHVVERMFEMHDRDSLGFKVQIRLISDDISGSKAIIENPGSAFTNFLAECFREINPQSTLQEQYARATLVASILDNYPFFRWHYAENLDVPLPKRELVQSYKDYLIEEVIPFLIRG